MSEKIAVSYADRPYDADGNVTVRIGSVSGAEQPDATELRPFNLYPYNKPLKRKGLNLKNARAWFLKGRRFFDKAGNPITIYDLPPGAKVILNCKDCTKLHLQVTTDCTLPMGQLTIGGTDRPN